MFETLEQFGITQQMLQIGLVCAFAAVLLALYWRLLAIGGGILFAAFIFFHQGTIAKSIDPVEAKANKVQLWQKQFMEDCVSVSMNSKSECETLWSEQESSITGDE